MPKAVVSNETSRHELKYAPGGFVVLKRMSYGDVLYRRGLAQRVEMTQTGRNEAKMNIEVGYEALAAFDFSHCISEHNLENEDGSLLNLNDISGVKLLDPQIGQEIEGYIDKLHEVDEDLAPLRPKSGAPSTKEEQPVKKLATSSS